MGRIVVVAEKPSVGRDIARVLGCRQSGEGCLIGDRYTVTWAVGHLVTLKEPDEMNPALKKWSYDTLPILPETIPLKIIAKTKPQFSIIKKLINDAETDRLICATDAGREGELIFRYIYEMSGCKKPFDRLWISSMTDEAIREGFEKIMPGTSYDGLYRSARSRSRADWIVGMNASRAYTLRYDALLSVGRVQTPTLAILVKRYHEIKDFKPEQFAVLTADFGDYQGTYFHPDFEPDTHFQDIEKARALAAELKGKDAKVLSAVTTRKKELPPQLYDLTTLQRDANRLLGFTANKTLSVAQELYEKRKALTYPRTDSRYLPPDMIPRVCETLRILPQSLQPFVPGTATAEGKLRVSSRTIDASKVTDHHAIIPTAKKVDPSTFTPDERALYDLVARRLLQAFYPANEYDATRVITGVGEHRFRTDGRVEIIPGWKAVPPLEQMPKAKSRKKAEETETALPPLAVGDERKVKNTSVKEDLTKPPAPHTDASLLAKMETAGRDIEDEELRRQMKASGIGTPATRAAIIERLIKVGYVVREKKTLQPTEKGIQLIALLPQEITSAEMTGRWEQALSKMADGEQSEEGFMTSIHRFAAFLVENAKTAQTGITIHDENRYGKGKGRSSGFKQKEVAECVCPLCGKGKIMESDRAFSCSGKSCHFTLWKDTLERGGGPVLSVRVIQPLLKNGSVRGSTGTITVDQKQISFYPSGSQTPSVTRSVEYIKK